MISRIESEYREYGEDYDVEQILGDIEDMPTAYSVDKVVAELEADTSVKLYGSGNSDNYLIPVNRAIEIVKRGGKEILQ